MEGCAERGHDTKIAEKIWKDWEEFAAYGLAVPLMIMAGIAKVLCAAGLIAGLYWPSLIVPSATLLTLLMLVAIALHFKIRDALVKSLPAIAMLVLCLSILGMSMLRD